MAEAPAKKAEDGNPLRLLLVEDSDVDALMVVQEVRQAGYVPTVERVQTGVAMRNALRKPWDLIIADYAMPGYSGMEALSVRNTYAIDTPFILVSGQITVEVAVEVLKAGAQDYVSKNQMGRLGVAVTRALKEAESRRESRHLQEQVLQAQKMEAVGQLAGGVAHDFNNILQVILGYTEVLLTDLREKQGQRSEVEQIHKAALRAAELTRQLLSFSRRQVISPSVVDLNAIIGGMRIMIERLMGEGIPVAIHLAAGYEVMAAATIREGLELFGREKGDFRLVFSDVVLPDGNGVDLVEQVLEKKPDMAILLSSGYVDDRARWKAIENRGFLFLAKPHSPSVLLRAIRSALDSSNPIQA